MKDLKINLLGPPEILWENQRLKINRRIPRTLLYYLATQENFTGRGKLLSIFWQDTSPKIARKRLREALSRIRTVIPLNNFIINENDLVGLDHSSLETDIIKFLAIQDDLSKSLMGRQPGPMLPDETKQILINALDLWRGTQFLEGTELPKSTYLEEWRYQTNLSLTHQRTSMLTSLCDHYFAKGQYEDGLTHARLAVKSDPYDEALHCRVLRFLVALERYPEAKQYYLTTTRFLNKELDIRPSQQLLSIYRQIQRKTRNRMISNRADWRLLASVRTPFVGREDEINSIQSAREKGQAVLISGDSGLGKTRLVQEFCGVYSSDSRIISTHCRPAEINLPFQPFIELLRNNVTSSEWDQFPSTWAGPLSTILPEILSGSTLINRPVLSISPEQNRSALLEAIRQVFMMLARSSDLVLFVDDLQWSDAESLSAIAYLVERTPFTSNAIMILAARPDEINPNVNNLLIANQSTSNLYLLELSALNPAEISDLGRYVLGYPLGNDLVQQLDFETGGNPFIVLETLHSFHKTDRIPGSRGTSGPTKLPLAKSVYNLIKGRLDQLSPAARETCEFAAVMGREFDPELISLAKEESMSTIARAIEELKQRNFIEPVQRPDREITWRFIHEKIRESIIADTNRIRLRLLHERIARALEEEYGAQHRSQAAVLARHYEYAGKNNIAFNYWLQAAQWARHLFSTGEARRILAHAENIITRNPDAISERLIQEFYTEWTELAYEIGDASQIREHNNRLLAFGQAQRSNPLIGTALVGLSNASMVENKFAEGLAFTNQAIPYLEHTENAYQIMNCHTNRGVYLYMQGRLPEAIESFELALTFGTGDGDSSIQRASANAYYHLALSQTLGGWPELGLKNAKMSLALANDIGHHHISVTAYLASSLAQYFLADYKKAGRDNEAGIEIAKKLQANRMLGYLYAVKAFLKCAEGELGPAHDFANMVFDIGKQHNHQELQSLALRIRGDIYIFLQSYEQALQEFELGYKLGKNDFWGLDNLIRKGYSQIKTGQAEIGMANLEHGIDLARTSGFGMVEIRGLQFLSYAYASRREQEKTIQLTEEIERIARLRSLPMVGLVAKINSTIASPASSNSAAEIDQLEYLLKMLDEQIQPYIAIRLLIQKIRLQNHFGLDAQEELTQIQKILNRCERFAYPQNIQKAFHQFREDVETMIHS